MFSVKLRSFYYICDKTIIRNIRNSRLSNPGSHSNNPGLNKRIQAFRNDGLKIEDDDAEEFIEASESDFSNVGEAYNEHMNETLMGKYNLGYHIVKEKYFKENMPNLLTWSEKEQIRLLAASAPNEWTPEKIAESFPVTEQVVKKLLKYPWKPATEQRIARHDASVMRNWRELKEGSLTISEELRKHFLKFSERTIPPIKKTSIKIDVTQEEKIGEFERIVLRCAAKETKENIDEQTETDNPDEEVSSEREVHQHKDSKRITLSELSKNIQKRLDSGNIVQMNDEIIVTSVHKKGSALDTVELNSDIELNDQNDKGNQLTEFKLEDSKPEKSIMDYPERIRIPKKAYKKGATYKVNDCYYDHDGKFLYRVLGMST